MKKEHAGAPAVPKGRAVATRYRSVLRAATNRSRRCRAAETPAHRLIWA